jgi:N-formylglutamate deformylase
MQIATLHRGTAPLLISLPHDGTRLPDDIPLRLTASARATPDTDWFVSRLYDFARELGASILVPSYSRYVIDLNRPPDDLSLYPGQNTTGLCPTVQFSGEPVYVAGQEPDALEIAVRLDRYWHPYHYELQGELLRLRAEHGRAVLWEGHSIRSRVPFLFDGRLPDLNLGTAAGSSCHPHTQARLEAVMRGQSTRSWISNGRFKGGYITRHYARPEENVEAIQLELAQCNYMDEDSGEYLEQHSAALQPLIRELLLAAIG